MLVNINWVKLNYQKVVFIWVVVNIYAQTRKKLGLENFSKEVLAICHSDVEENILERLFIAFYKSIGKAEYNRAKGGNGIDYYDFLSDEQKQEMNRKNSARLKEMWKNPES